MPTVKRLDEAIERLLLAVARRSGRLVTVLVVLLYAGVGLALPLLLGWRVAWLVAANVIGTSLAGTLVLMWLGIRVQAQHRRHLVEWTTNLRLLHAAEFEWLVGEVYRRQGWTVEETGRQSGPDGNIDLRLVKDHERVIVQCKRWTARLVGVEEIRAFGGTLLREGLPGDAGVFVTLSDFTDQARAEAEALGISVIDNRDLYARVEQVRTPEHCPECEAAMVLGLSSRGWWFRCVTPGCSGKRDLGGEPGRAVELLTQVP
jgi:hypothetical protein